MPQYRCYFLDPANRVTSFTVLDCATNAIAVAEADKLWNDRGCYGIELWNGAEMVHQQLGAQDNSPVAASAAPDAALATAQSDLRGNVSV